MPSENDKAVILYSHMGEDFAAGVYNHLQQRDPSLFTEGHVDVRFFSNKEPDIKILSNVARRRVYLFQSFQGYQKELDAPHVTYDPNVGSMTLFKECDALKRASAEKIIIVIPHGPWQREDRKDEGRVAISAKLFMDLVEKAAGRPLERVMTIEMHSGQQQGFADYPIDNLYANKIFAQYFQKLVQTLNEDFVIVSPDPGGVKRARDLANRLGKDGIVYCDKIKKGPEKEKTILTGEVNASTAIIPEDCIDTAKTIVLATSLLRERRVEDIYACATHPIFSPKDGITAEQRLQDAGVKTVVGNTIPMSREYVMRNSSWLTVLPFEKLFADAIYERETKGSVSRLFENDA